MSQTVSQSVCQGERGYKQVGNKGRREGAIKGVEVLKEGIRVSE